MADGWYTYKVVGTRIVAPTATFVINNPYPDKRAVGPQLHLHDLQPEVLRAAAAGGLRHVRVGTRRSASRRPTSTRSRGAERCTSGSGARCRATGAAKLAGSLLLLLAALAVLFLRGLPVRRAAAAVEQRQRRPAGHRPRPTDQPNVAHSGLARAQPDEHRAVPARPAACARSIPQVSTDAATAAYDTGPGWPRTPPRCPHDYEFPVVPLTRFLDDAAESVPDQPRRHASSGRR